MSGDVTSALASWDSFGDGARGGGAGLDFGLGVTMIAILLEFLEIVATDLDRFGDIGVRTREELGENGLPSLDIVGGLDHVFRASQFGAG